MVRRSGAGDFPRWGPSARFTESFRPLEQRVPRRFARWSKSGEWQALFMEQSKDSEFASRVHLDSTIVRAHQYAVGAINGPQGLGRSRGGLTSKIHALVEGIGQLIRFTITGGEVADITQAKALLVGSPVQIAVADKGYDSGELVDFIREGGATAVIPPRCNRLRRRRYDRLAYRDRNRVARFFCRPKQFGRFATRYDKPVERYASIVALGASFVWLNA